MSVSVQSALKVSIDLAGIRNNPGRDICVVTYEDGFFKCVKCVTDFFKILNQSSRNIFLRPVFNGDHD